MGVVVWPELLRRFQHCVSPNAIHQIFIKRSMKSFFFVALLAMPLLGMAQSAQNSPAPETRLFQPLSLPGQQRPVVAPKAPLLSQQDVYYVILIVLLLAIFGSAVLACWKVSSIVLQILIAISALGAGAFVSFVLLTMIGLTGTPDNSKAGLARRAMVEMGKALGLPNETIAAVVEDDEYRVCMLLGEQVLVIADYGENRGLLLPYASLDSVNSHEGPAQTLPLLPPPAADRWVIETEAARESNDTTNLQQIEWHFRGAGLSIIAVRYARPDYFFPHVASIASLCRQRMAENK
jgi:hypothetical protein